MKKIGQKIVAVSHAGCSAAIETRNFSALRLMQLTVVAEREDVPGDTDPAVLHKGYRAIGRIPGEQSDSSFSCQWFEFSDASTQPYHTWCLIPVNEKQPTEWEIENYLWADASLVAGRVDDTKAFADHVNSHFPGALDHCLECVETPNRPREFSTTRTNCWFCKAADRPACIDQAPPGQRSGS